VAAEEASVGGTGAATAVKPELAVGIALDVPVSSTIAVAMNHSVDGAAVAEVTIPEGVMATEEALERGLIPSSAKLDNWHTARDTGVTGGSQQEAHKVRQERLREGNRQR